MSPNFRFFTGIARWLLTLTVLGALMAGCSAASVGETTADLASRSALLALSSQTEGNEMDRELSPEAIYAAVAPSIAHVSTVSDSQGSGILLELDGDLRFVMTNAHVVWPYTEAAIVFADGVELSEVPVVEVDEMLDLALLGPVDVDAPAASIAGIADLPIGRELYLIGYPRETETLPQPTISRGILSRIRHWDTMDVAYLQTDALIAGGQSGGALVNEDGSVVGISGWGYDEGFAFAASIEHIWDRIEGLAAGDDVDGLGDRTVPMPDDDSSDSERYELFGDIDTAAAVFFDSEPVDWWAEAKSWGDLRLRLFDENGFMYEMIDEQEAGAESLEQILTENVTFFLVSDQWDTDGSVAELNSTSPFALYFDDDDYVSIEIGDEISGHIDYPGDWDAYLIDMAEGDTIAITFESLSIDPYLIMKPPLDSDYLDVDVTVNNFILRGDDVPIIYRAPQDGTFALSISSYGDDYSVNSRRGGYILRVSEAPDDAVPMLVPMAEQEWDDVEPEETDAEE